MRNLVRTKDDGPVATLTAGKEEILSVDRESPVAEVSATRLAMA